MLDRVRIAPPGSVEAESALLAALLHDNAAIDRVQGIVEASDFAEPIHAHLFGAMVAMRQEDRTASPITLRPHLEGWPDITADLTAVGYLNRLAVRGLATLDAMGYAQAVRELAARRKLYMLGHDLIDASANAELPIDSIASEAVTALDNVLALSRAKQAKPVSIGDAIRDALDSVLNDDGSAIITTGLKDLDKTLGGGWRRKQYAIIAGRPSMGKTTLATSAMLRTAKAGYGVYFLSLEMAAREISLRSVSDLCYSSRSRVEYNNLSAGKSSQGDWASVALATDEYRRLPLVIDDSGRPTIAEIASRVRAQAQRFERDGGKLGLVVIDHLGFIKASDRYRGNRVHEVTEISAGLGQIAKEHDVCLIVLSQLNRGTEGRENKRPSLSDLRDSGSLEQDADVVLFCYREAYYLERTKHDPGSQAELKRQTELEATRNTLEVIVAKNRMGPTGIVNLFCDMGCNAVRGLAA